MAASPGRSIWNGTLSFGLVAIPISLYTATETHDISFKQVHRTNDCGGLVKQRRFCSVDGEEVPFADVAKGYQRGDGDIVILGDTDLADLALPTTKTLEVLKFVTADEVDPMLYSKAYYVRPAKEAVSPFALLTRAMENTGLVGIVKVALRQRESLGLLRLGQDGVMTLILLLWPDEVREPVKPDEVQLNPALVDQAEQLIGAMTGPFNPEEYVDNYATAVHAMIEAKTSGIALPAAAKAAPASGPADLSSILKASVAAAAKKTPKARSAGKGKGKKVS